MQKLSANISVTPGLDYRTLKVLLEKRTGLTSSRMQQRNIKEN